MHSLKLIFTAAFSAWFLFASEGALVKRGLWKVFKYEEANDLPVLFSGWSRSDEAFAHEYCIFLDVHYSDGSAAWGRHADFRPGTHGWEETKGIFVPEKPVSRIEMSALFRSKGGKTRGSVQFKDFRLERREGTGETFSVFSVTDRPFSDSRIETRTVFNGRKTDIATRRVPELTQRTSPIPKGTVKVWTASSMQVVTPLTFPGEEAGNSICLAVAGRERESAQVLVSSPADEEIRDVVLEISGLKRRDGLSFRGAVEWRRQGYLAREHGAKMHPYAFPSGERWFPDPLLPPSPMRVRPASTQGAWITVFAQADAAAGEYFGHIDVKSGGRTLAKVPLAVVVRDFSLGKTFGMDTAFSLMDGFIRALYPDDFAVRKREAIDLMLDHRLNPDDISRTSPPEIGDLLHARSRGMSRFNILNIVPPPKSKDERWVLTCSGKTIADGRFYGDFVGRVKPYVEKLRKYGLDDMAYVYGFDEAPKSFYPAIGDFWRKFKRDVPGIPVMTTACSYRDFVKGNVGEVACDWLCPTTDVYDFPASQALRREGKKVWWYVCCSPAYPYANFASWEYPPIEGRLLGWMTYLYRSDGLLFWIVNKWHGNRRFGERDTFFPDFRTRNRQGMPGDGIMMYPGETSVWPSIRLAQCRDAVEDCEYLMLAERMASREASEKAARTIVDSLCDFSRDPAKLYEARERLSEIITQRKER